MRRFALRALVVLVAIVIAGAIGLYGLARRSLPALNGSVTVTGISGPVDIVRDADGIPHIFGATKRDAYFGLGYVHAQDRLWQMEFQRRIGFGRLSEIFGAATVPQDRFLRTVGFGRAARAAWNSMPDWARKDVDAYVGGVNAFLAAHHGSQLPPEFSLLRFEPEPWTGADVVAWVKMMAWDLSANYSFELLRHDLAAMVGSERAAQLMPPYPADGLNIVPDHPVAEATDPRGRREPMVERRTEPAPTGASNVDSVAAALSQGLPDVAEFLLGNTTTEALGSNNWVVDGTLTESGKPLLANDPHLSTKLPSTWYLAHVSAPDFEIIGATLPGVPAVALGRNRFIAWGSTNVAADVEDLFRERLDPTEHSAEYRGALEPLQTLVETIRVKGGQSVAVTVRSTRHGPLVSDAINANNAASRRQPKPVPLEPLAFRWTALDPDDSTLPSFLRLNEARNWTDFTAALRDFVVPSQNFVYADVDGHIGYYAPGRIPIRAHGDGAQPADGWTGESEWIGWVPFEDLPHLADPPNHVVVTANNRPAGPGYRYHLGLEWPQPYRAERVLDLLGQFRGGSEGHHRITPDDFARMQADRLSRHALDLLPLLLKRTHPQTDADRRAVDLVRGWNAVAQGDSAAAAVFEAWFLELAPAIAGDELGPIALGAYQGRFSFVTRFVKQVLSESPDSAWCDIRYTDEHETCDEVVTDALHRAVVELTRRMGSDPARWRWDAVHRVMFPHQGLDAVATLRPLISRSVAGAGDWSSVNVGTVDVDVPYEQHAASGYRQIIDLSPANDSRFIDAVGESGHLLSRHYDDFLRDWQAVKYRRMQMDRTEIEKTATGRLQLRPAK